MTAAAPLGPPSKPASADGCPRVWPRAAATAGDGPGAPGPWGSVPMFFKQSRTPCALWCSAPVGGAPGSAHEGQGAALGAVTLSRGTYLPPNNRPQEGTSPLQQPGRGSQFSPPRAHALSCPERAWWWLRAPPAPGGCGQRWEWPQAHVWGHFLAVVTRGGWLCWELMGRTRGCCQMLGAQDSLIAKNVLVQNVRGDDCFPLVTQSLSHWLSGSSLNMPSLSCLLFTV